MTVLLSSSYIVLILKLENFLRKHLKLAEYSAQTFDGTTLLPRVIFAASNAPCKMRIEVAKG